jgi:5-methyltetrahydropteroyltriglutamate--homocysteine methyltransferase
VKELVFLAKAFDNPDAAAAGIGANAKIMAAKKTSPLTTDEEVRKRLGSIPKGASRQGAFAERNALQKAALNLPPLPTTTIGSYPQTPEVRALRQDLKAQKITQAQYEAGVKAYIDDCVAFQEEAGLDVLVHGEPERNDMVEYFGEMLKGFHFTKNAWVQSYGSRCVKPPIIYGDVSRPYPMTVKWITYAQSLTKKPMKGMLTGPVTILTWSFVRDDLPRSEVSRQIAAALYDEVKDLQEAGIRIVQVDEAAFKEGYPLRKENIPAYEEWAVDAFRLTVSGAKKETQIQTHMCYSDFTGIIHTIERMDADVILIETARSGNTLLRVFKEQGYANEIGPGVYDIHSPRVPGAEEFAEQIRARLAVLPRDKMWVNPDCGLKTRRWEEVKPALKNMVEAARKLR